MRIVPAALLIAGIACTGERHPASRGDAWVAERDTVGDTLVVRTVRGSAWGSPRRLVERVSIGVADGAEELMFGDVSGIAVAGDGSVYVVDRTPTLRKFGPDGTLIRAFGRVGSGPGEYRRPDGGVAVLPDGRVVLRDPGNGRLAVFAADGTPLTTWTISSTLNTSRKLYVDTAGSVYPLIILGPAADPSDWRMGLLRFDSTGKARDSVATPRWDFKPATIKGQAEGSTSINDVPFSPRVHWTFSPLGYMVGGVSTHYRIDLFRRDGVLRIERDTPGVPVQSEEASDERDVATHNMRQSFPGWVWNGPDVPSTKPPFRDVYAGEDGRIWVLLSRSGVKADDAGGPDPNGFRDSPWSEPIAFDVYEPDGRYLGEVSAPSGFLRHPEPTFRGDTVWAAVEDAEGARYVKRFELGAAPADSVGRN